MSKQKVSPEIEQAVKELFTAMSQKSNVGDFPCKDIPCEHWWVRYAVGCTYLSHAQEEIWKPRLEELQAKYQFNGYSHKGKFSLSDCKNTKKEIQAYLNAKIWVFSTKLKRDVEVTNHISELYHVLEHHIQNQVTWYDCPYQMDKQSKCPFYKESQFYKMRKEAEAKASFGVKTSK
jgi:hypothetical protein